MGRAPCCDKANVKRGPWSPEEDTTLKSYVEANGTGGSWIGLPKKAGLRRCGKSCRLRWLNYLRPDIKHGGFTEEEDKIICSLFNEIGSRWSVIASHLPGRTDNDVKNYWNTKLRKKLFTGKLVGCVKNSTNDVISTRTPTFLGFTTNHVSSLPKIDMYHHGITPSKIYGLVSAEFPAISDTIAGVASTNNVHNSTHYHNTGFNFNTINSEFGTTSSSHEGSLSTSISTNSSSISSSSSFAKDDKALPLDCSRGSLEAASFMMDFGFAFEFPCEAVNNNGLWFQEKAHENTVTNCSYSAPSSADLNYLC